MPDDSNSEDQAEAQPEHTNAADPGSAEGSGEETPAYDESPYDDAGASRIRLTPALLAALIVVPAIVVGLVVWFVASATAPENKSRLAADVANVVNAFSQSSSSDTVTSRYEGQTPPLYPTTIPKYPGAGIVSSVMQVTGEDAAYLVIYDTSDSRQKVSSYFDKRLGQNPWQIDASQDGRDSDVRQFSSGSDPNLRALVLVAGSKQDNRTTIVMSVQVTSGAKNLVRQPFSPGKSKPLPEGFPSTVPQYPGSTVIESSYQKQPPSTMYTVSLVTKDNSSKVLDYYRTQLKSGGLTVDAASSAPGATPQAQPTPSNTTVTFTDAKQTVNGQISATPLAEDQSYTRIDLQVTTTGQ